MYENFRVKNFRCFQDFKLGPLARVNLIAGRNNVGKTALLEALWLFSGPDLPDLGVRASRFRGMPGVSSEGFLNDLFWSFDSSLAIGISANGDWGSRERILEIQKTGRQPTQVPLAEAGTTGSGVSRGEHVAAPMVESEDEIVLTYTDETEAVFHSRGWLIQEQIGPGVTQEGMRMAQQLVKGRPQSVYIAARHREPPVADVERFSKFEIEGREDEVVEALKIAEPRLKRLTIIADRNASMVFGDVGTGRLMPVPLMGDGTNRLLSLVLAFATARNGIVLVDEVENGFHHTIMVDIWKALAHFARTFNVQMFVTTHSHECLRSAHEAFKQDEDYAFRLHRLNRVDDKITAVSYDQEMLETALESGLEVR